MQTLTRSMKIMKMMMVMINKPKLVGWQDTNMTADLFYANKCLMFNMMILTIRSEISTDKDSSETEIYQRKILPNNSIKHSRLKPLLANKDDYLTVVALRNGNLSWPDNLSFSCNFSPASLILINDGNLSRDKYQM